jgi:hypothetical protein
MRASVVVFRAPSGPFLPPQTTRDNPSQIAQTFLQLALLFLLQGEKARMRALLNSLKDHHAQ